MCRPNREQARSHKVVWRFRDLRVAAFPCGSELARDGGVSGAIDVGCAGLIASKLAPTRLFGVSGFFAG